MKDDFSILVNEICVWPRVGLVGIPDGAVKIRYYRPRQLKAGSRLPDIFDAEAHGKFAIMHAHHIKTVRVVFGI